VHAEAPIGVFDSGVGGLTVLRTLIEKLPHEHTVYLGDTARVPYGTRSAETVTRYALLCARHLARHDIKMLVVACNTVSAHSLPALAQALPIPVVGVIEPGAQTAAARTRGGTIAVLATPGTVASGAYQAALRRLAPLSSVVARACPLFVPLAEEGWTEGEVPRLTAERYLADLRRVADTVLLGCTHYPLLEPAIHRTLASMGHPLTIIDSAQATAHAVAAHPALVSHISAPKAQNCLFYATDSVEKFQRLGSAFLGQPVTGVRHIDLGG